MRTRQANDAIRVRAYRRRDSAQVLGVSESLIPVLERRGLITPLRLAAFGRVVRHDADEVDALAERLIAEAKVAAKAG